MTGCIFAPGYKGKETGFIIFTYYEVQRSKQIIVITSTEGEWVSC